jgi:cation:H+ antiporter
MIPSTAPTAVLIVSVCVWTALSLAASAVLIVRLERLGVRFGLTEASLGLIAALAADAPEITSAITALSRGQRDIGVGVVLGSNVFNLAALLGLGAVVARRIVLDRRVVVLEGAVGVWLALVCLLVVGGVLPPGVGFVAALVVFVPYAVLSAMQPARRATLRVPRHVRTLLVGAVGEEERELAQVSDHHVGGRRDAVHAGIAIVVVVVASVQMETSFTEMGGRWHLSNAIVGAVILAAVTSLPNAVAAVYLARRGRGAATLSEAMNSNTINAVVGFLLPATLIGIGTVSAATETVALWYGGLTVATLAVAYTLRGIPRLVGVLIIAAYAGFVVAL